MVIAVTVASEHETGEAGEPDGKQDVFNLTSLSTRISVSCQISKTKAPVLEIIEHSGT